MSVFVVDLFFLKTCSFNGVKPRIFEQHYSEGLFCLETPAARFPITPCGKPSCLCCHPPCPRPDSTAAIPFSVLRIHRFVNRYEAILNCPAVCLKSVLPICIESRLQCWRFFSRPAKVKIASTL